MTLSHGTMPRDGAPWPICVSNEPTVPDEVITLYDTFPRMFGRTQEDGEIQEHYGINFRLRSSDPVVGFYKCAEIANAVDREILRSVVSVGALTYGANAIPAATYIVYSVTRMVYTRGATGFLYLGKERKQNVTGDLVTTSNRDIYSLNASASIRLTS